MRCDWSECNVVIKVNNEFSFLVRKWINLVNIYYTNQVVVQSLDLCSTIDFEHFPCISYSNHRLLEMFEKISLYFFSGLISRTKIFSPIFILLKNFDSKIPLPQSYKDFHSKTTLFKGGYIFQHNNVSKSKVLNINYCIIY